MNLRIRELCESDARDFAAAFREIGWRKPASQFLDYLSEQASGARAVFVACVEDEPVGYVTLLWTAQDRTFAEQGIPEIMDLNVLPHRRRSGVGSALLDAAEAAAATRSDVVGLGVGLHSGYGAAQRLYVNRGYVPDGDGIVIDGEPVPDGVSVPIDDDVSLRMTRRLT